MPGNLWVTVTHSIRKGFDRLMNLATDPSLKLRAAGPVGVLVVITLISYLSVDLLYKIAGLALSTRVATVNGPAAPASAAQVATRPVLGDYDLIAKRNLFATTGQAIADPAAAGDFSAGEEYTAFDLKGTIAVDDDFGFVVVEEKGSGKQKLYRIGEMIGSARLIRITRNAAILTSGGRELVMRVKEAQDTSPVSRLGRSTPAPAASGIAISREEVTQSLGDLKSIMSQAVVRPFLHEGVQQGYIVSNIVPGSLYEKLGLQNGDIIVDVNGKSLDSADDVLQLVNLMQSGGGISLNLLRGGQSETINYSFH
ncbi:MAG: PDZ domain-containing protein [Smithellaceae bacterium]